MKYYCVYDFETDGKDPETCNPVEIACVMIDPYTLDIVEGSEFSSGIKPKGIDKEGYFTEERNETIAFHAKHNNCSSEDIIAKWKEYPEEKVVWKMFSQHINKYNTSGTQWDAPIPAGMNIINFDAIIVNRLNKRHKIERMFNYERVDLRDVAFLWLQWDRKLTKRSQESLLKYFNMDSSGLHTALVDTMNTANLISRFLKLHKRLFAQIQFQGAK